MVFLFIYLNSIFHLAKDSLLKKLTLFRHTIYIIVKRKQKTFYVKHSSQSPKWEVVKKSATTLLQTLLKVELVKCLWSIKARLHCVCVSRTLDKFYWPFFTIIFTAVFVLTLFCLYETDVWIYRWSKSSLFNPRWRMLYCFAASSKNTKTFYFCRCT